MTTFAMLGTIVFEPLTSFTREEYRAGVDYAEHPLIEGKPDLQYIGAGLAERRIGLGFHAAYCDPQAQLTALYAAALAHQPLTLVFGDGTVKGDFVITEVSADYRWRDPEGRLLAAEAEVTLREYVRVRYVDVAENGVEQR